MNVLLDRIREAAIRKAALPGSAWLLTGNDAAFKLLVQAKSVLPVLRSQRRSMSYLVDRYVREIDTALRISSI
jgi:hypothetical protein